MAVTEYETPYWWHRWVTFKKTDFCSQCGKVGPHLKRCGGCKSVSYCNVECQKVHWKKEGHKNVCREASQSDEDFRRKVYAEIIAPPAQEDDPVGLRIHGRSDKVFMKREKLAFVPDSETLRVCRMDSKGEEPIDGGYYHDQRWPIAILKEMPNQVAPISTLLGIPLRVACVKPRSQLLERVDYDNVWATWMMIDPVSGFAPLEWQSYVGPVVVWRPIGAVSTHDMCLLNDFLNIMLDRYSEGDVIPRRDLTPKEWTYWKSSLIRRDGDGLMQYTDINI